MKHAARNRNSEREEKRPQSFSAYLNQALRVSDIPLSAIDFHCVPGIVDHLLASDGDASEAQAQLGAGKDLPSTLRSAMWYFSSSRNTKRLVTTGKSRADGGAERKRLLKLWSRHQRSAVVFQQNFIHSRFSKRR